MASAIFQRSVRPRKEDENLDASSAASEQEETSSTSGDEDRDASLNLSNGPDSEIQPEWHDGDVYFFTLYSLRYISNWLIRPMQPPTRSQKI
jgi:hypothetical protein